MISQDTLEWIRHWLIDTDQVEECAAGGTDKQYDEIMQWCKEDSE